MTCRLLEDWMALPEPTAATYHFLAGLGVTLEAALRAGGLALARINTAGRMWNPDPRGRSAIVVAIFAHRAPSLWHGVEKVEPVDLIALNPRNPEEWWRRHCAPSVALGIEHLHDYEAGRSVTLFSSPLTWLRGGCDGAVLLDEAEQLRDNRRLLEHSKPG